jgi:Domain of unknown function (DUF4129)
MGDRLRAVSDFFAGLAGSWSGRLVLGALLVVVVVAIVPVVAKHKRGSSPGTASPRSARGGRPVDPAQLEKDADAAERAGDYERAVRLRFVAGLVRLNALGVIELAPSLTSGQVTRRLRLVALDDLARDYDEIAYGRRAATRSDVDAARTRWPAVLVAARRT